MRVARLPGGGEAEGGVAGLRRRGVTPLLRGERRTE